MSKQQEFKKRKDGRYRRSVSLRKETGSKKPKLIYGHTLDELDAKYTDYKYKKMHGNITDSKNLTVFGYLETWIELRKKGNKNKKKLSPQTLAGYDNYIYNHIQHDDFGSMLLERIKPMHVEAFYDRERDADRGMDKHGNIIIGFSEKTILQEHRILHKAFEDAVKNELINKNPCDYADAPTPEKYKVTIYDEEKFNDLLDIIKDTDDEMPILLAGMCGLRRSEIFGLPWHDIDFENEQISVNQVLIYNKYEKKWEIREKPKTQTSRRKFSIPSEIVPIFKKRKGIGLVCCNPDGSMVNGGTYSHHFADLLKENDLPHIRFHDLRHFNITMMLKYGMSNKEAAHRSGHSNPTTLTTVYQHILDDMDRQNADKLNTILHKKNDKGQKKGQS